MPDEQWNYQQPESTYDSEGCGARLKTLYRRFAQWAIMTPAVKPTMMENIVQKRTATAVAAGQQARMASK